MTKIGSKIEYALDIPEDKKKVLQREATRACYRWLKMSEEFEDGYRLGPEELDGGRVKYKTVGPIIKNATLRKYDDKEVMREEYAFEVE